MVYFLSSKTSYEFPPPSLADYDGLLAVGGDLCVKRLLNAYTKGIFPWYNPDEIISWWCPKNRYIIRPEKVHVSRSMKKLLAKDKYEIEFNQDFSEIMHSCRTLREGKTWISDDMENAFAELFKEGHVLCIGVYERGFGESIPIENKKLVGGLYGVSIGRCFFGESMFSKIPSGSKIAFASLGEKLRKENFTMIDCQFYTEHLESLGGEWANWEEYNKLLDEGLKDVDLETLLW